MPGLRERKSLAVKQAFFNAAIELIKKKGFEDTSVDEIAESAGYSRATYFNHFGTKQGVLRFYGQRLQEKVEASLAEADSLAPPLDRIRGLLFTMAREADAHSEELKLVYLHSRNDAEYLAQPTAARLRVYDMVRVLVQEAQGAGQIRTDLSAQELALHILAIYQGALMASIAGYSKAAPLVDTGWNFILDGVHGGPPLAE